MAFEAFQGAVRGAGARRAQAPVVRAVDRVPRRADRRRVAYSFWHIEELSPPLLKVTFLSAAPPPPPAAPPPAGGGDGAEEEGAVKPKTVVQPKPDIVQPQRDAEEGRAAERRAEAGRPRREGRREGRHHRRHARRDDRRHARRHHRRHARRRRRRAARRRRSSCRPTWRKQQLVDGRDPPFPPSLNHGGASIACWSRFASRPAAPSTR